MRSKARRKWMSIDPRTAFSLYAQAWDGKLDAAARSELLSQAWADDGELFDPETPGGLVGRAALGAYIQEQHEASPGMVVSGTAEPEMLGDRLRGRWAQYEDGVLTLSGADFVEFAEDGRIQKLTMFFDSSPESAAS
jgi:hypothetical protein